MKCPRCSAAMETVPIENVQIDRCTKCGGLWFDEFELSDLKAQNGSERIDTGHADKATQRSQTRINCPKCSIPMLRMVDAQQPHIWYETCDECGGSYFDAGEFKELKRHNIVGLIKDVLIELKGGRDAPKTKLSPSIIRKVLQ
jgi:Zn-finger nucleic acid-binding protein